MINHKSKKFFIIRPSHSDAPFGAVGEIGHQATVGDCKMETTSSEAGYLVGLE